MKKRATSRKKSYPAVQGVAPSPIARIVALSEAALKVAKTARRNKQRLDGANFYANKMAELRADATNAFREVGEASVDQTASLASSLEVVFSVTADPVKRAQAARDLKYGLSTATIPATPSKVAKEDGGIFPLVKLEHTKRAYLVRVGRQMNGAYAEGWYDACAVMMRRLLETAIIEAFEANGIDSKIKDSRGHFLMLTALVDAALAETWNLGRNVTDNLHKLKEAGHTSAHSRRYIAEKSDVDKVQPVFRESVEVFLHLAKLLK